MRIALFCRAVMAAALLLMIALPAHAADKKKIVIIAGNKSHGAGQHNWGEGAELLARALNEESGLPVEAVVYKLWPTTNDAFDGAATVVILCDGGGGHVVMKHLDEFRKVMDRGVGLVCIHYAVEVPKGDAGDAFLQWMGGYFETNYSVNPVWKADIKVAENHPVARGVKPFEHNDEWYYHMRFPKDMTGVTPILSALPPPETLTRKDGPHEGNPDVRAAVLERKEPQHLAWAYQRPAGTGGGGRGFGLTGTHFHKSWDNDSFRTVVLNGIIWTAQMEVPENGVKSLPNPTQRPLTDTAK